MPADLTGPSGIESQPVSSVFWVPRDRVQANDYNPNRVFPPEMRLLKVSLLADGWTQPLVVRPVVGTSEPKIDFKRGEDEWKIRLSQDASFGFELVDGYHRWLAAEDPRIAAMTGGEVPCSLVIPQSFEHQKMSTIRHNRARGEHQVVDMAAIVAQLLDAGHPIEEIMDLLQMEKEEVIRLRDRGNMLERASGETFNQGWTSG